MRSYSRKTHTIDLVFTISLFCVFAISALAVTVAGAAPYQKTADQSGIEYSLYTGLSYIEQKVHACDASGSIYIEETEMGDTLCLSQDISQEPYVTYIYIYEGKLMEYFTRKDAQADLSAGTALLNAVSMELEETRDTLSLTITEPGGNAETLLLPLHADKEA